MCREGGVLGRVTERERETNGKGERVVRQGENTLGRVRAVESLQCVRSVWGKPR